MNLTQGARKNILANYERLLVFIFLSHDAAFLFQETLSPLLSCAIGFLTFLLAYLVCRSVLRKSAYHSIIVMLIGSVNSSFCSVLPVPYQKLPLSWFLICSLLLIVFSVCKTTKIYTSAFATFFLGVLLVLSLPSLSTSSLKDAINQFINIALFILIANLSINNRMHVEVFRFMIRMYVFCAAICAILLFLQSSFHFYAGLDVGSITYAASRISYAALFFDSSFCSLYLTSALTVVVVDYLQKSALFQFFETIALGLMFVVSVLLVNARTGLFAFLASTGLCVMSKILRGKKRAIGALLLSVPVAVYLIQTSVQSRGGQSFMDGSGRLSTYMRGLQAFAQHPLLGSGFGINNYTKIANAIIPHNILVQYLAQFGLIGLLVILFGCLPMFRTLIRDKGVLKWALITTLIGSMLIPDIVSSHFFTVLVCLANSKRVPHAFYDLWATSKEKGAEL